MMFSPTSLDHPVPHSKDRPANRGQDQARPDAQALILDELPTPSLLLDYERLERNLRTMAERCARRGVALRPHLKTVKCAEAAKLARRLGARGFTVSTLQEAEFFFTHGFDDLIYPATPVGLKLDRAAALVRAGCTLRVTVEQVDGAELLMAAGRRLGVAFETLIEIDSGDHRAGIAPDSAALLTIAAALRGFEKEKAGARLAGVLTHGGHSYRGRTAGEMRAYAEQEREAVVGGAERLRCAGHACEIVSGGSTPTAVHGVEHAGLTELRPGVYMLGDVFQVTAGSHTLDDIAANVLTAVIGHQRANGTLLIDAGSMALTKDCSAGPLSDPSDTGYGLIADASGRVLSNLRVIGLYQEHGVVGSRDPRIPIDLAAFPLGTKLRVLPHHACLTAAQFDLYHVHQAGRVVGQWTRVRGW